MIVGNSGIKYKSLLFAIIFISMFLFMAPNLCQATALAVSKAVINYNNVLRGGYAEDYVYISTDTDFDVPITYNITGDIENWVSFEPSINDTNATLYASRNHVQPLKVIIQPPTNVAIGNYTGSLRIMTGTFNKPGGPYGSQDQAAFLIRITVEVVGTQLLSCNVGGITILDAESGKPLDYSMTVSNDGNVRVSPNVSIDIWNQDQTRTMGSRFSDFNGEFVLPTTSSALYASFDNGLAIGQYWAYVTVMPCAKSQLVSFSVVEQGTIADNGELMRIENKPWASIGEIVPITAFFKNTGSRIVSAKFKGVVTMDNKIISNLESDYYDVQPGELFNMTVYFTPKDFGQYFISGRVLYNNKLSFEKSSILNVNSGNPASGFNYLYIVLIIVILIIIIVLVNRIRHTMKKMRRL